MSDSDMSNDDNCKGYPSSFGKTRARMGKILISREDLADAGPSAAFVSPINRGKTARGKKKTIKKKRVESMQIFSTPINNNSINSNDNNNNGPAGTVSAQEVLTTQAGLPRQRMKWTDDMNIDLMRCYLSVTQNETNLTGYRIAVHKEFGRRRPDLANLSEQRLADQIRVIFRNSRLSSEIIQQLRAEVASQPEEQPLDNFLQDDPNKVTIPSSVKDDEPAQPSNTAMGHVPAGLGQEIRTAFLTALTNYDGTDPSTRYSLPKLNNSKKLALITQFLNKEILPPYFEENNTFEAIHLAVYAAATATVSVLGLKSRKPNEAPRQQREPPWMHRLKKKIANLRRDVARLQQYQNGNRHQKLVQKVNELLRKVTVHAKYNPENQTAAEVMDTQKQKLKAASQRLRRYKESNLRKDHNKLFCRNQRQFYRSLQTDPMQPNSYNGVPEREDVSRFWSEIWSIPVQHRADSFWIAREQQSLEQIDQMTLLEIKAESLTEIIQQTHNWKAPGIDQIHNFWYKRLTCTHPLLAHHFNSFLRHPNLVPAFMTQGITYLLPKGENTRDPSKYRPITCLPTIYKIFTAYISKEIYHHCEVNNILAEEQKGCIKGSQGCKEQLVIDLVILNQARSKRKNLYVSYIDYRKAFDSVPHSWLIHVLRMYKVDLKVVSFLEYMMASWRTTLQLNHSGKRIITEPIAIRRGIFQGDSLSPLWFCLALTPLSNMLNNTGLGYSFSREQNQKVSHLLYMDDLKLYASSSDELQRLLRTTETFSQDICMSFGLDKCKTLSVRKGVQHAVGFDLQNGTSIDPLGEEETYKYLGIQQALKVYHKQLKDTTTRRYLERVRRIVRTKLSGNNMCKALNAWAIPTLVYTFGIIKWNKTDLENLERKTRTIMTSHRIHHPKSATERLTLPRSQGGRGLINIMQLHSKQIISLRKYFETKKTTSPLHCAIVQSDNKYTPLDLQHHVPLTELQVPDPRNEDLIGTWKQKALHGRHPHDLSQAHVDKIASNYWLSHGDLFPETEGFVMAIQDQVVATKNYMKFIVKDKNTPNDTCRQCSAAPETIQHITSGCRTLSATDYTHRHNQVAKIIHRRLALQHKLIPSAPPYYEYTPAAILENEDYRMYWDRSVITDRKILANRPDIIVTYKTQKQTYVIDITVPNTHNLQQSYGEKLNKYCELAEEIKKMWQQDKVTILPIIISTTGVVPKSLSKNLEIIDIHPHVVTKIQKAVLLNTCNTVRKFLNLPTTPP